MPDNASILEHRVASVPRGIDTAAPVFVARIENAEIWDAEGKRHIDVASGIAVTNAGRSHSRVMKAVAEKAQKFTHVAFQATGNEIHVEPDGLGGNPIPVAAPLAVLDVIEDENLCDRAIGDVRGLGTMVAFELLKRARPRCGQSRNIGGAGCGSYGNTIRILSPLTIDMDDLHEGLDILEVALKA